jgi:hypothetical protein
MKRIAICLSSQLREIDKTLENIKNTFEWYFYKSKIDYFIYSPNYLNNLPPSPMMRMEALERKGILLYIRNTISFDNAINPTIFD